MTGAYGYNPAMTHAPGHTGENVTFAYACSAYLHHLSSSQTRHPLSYRLAAQRLHSLLHHVPEWERLDMQVLHYGECLSTALKVAPSFQYRQDYQLLLHDFFRYAARRGWVKQGAFPAVPLP